MPTRALRRPPRPRSLRRSSSRSYATFSNDKALTTALLQRQGATEREALTTALYAVHAASTFGTGAHASISETGAAELIRQVMVRFPRLVSEGEAALWRLWKRSGQRELDAQVSSDCFSLMGSECDESPVTNLR